MSNEPTYNEALNELNEIARAMENETIPVDELTTRLRRATELLHYCRTKLKMTEEEAKKILGEMGE